MQLTQKHFQFIAGILADLKPVDITTLQRQQWIVTVTRFADELEKTNPKFKRDLFLKASGIQVVEPDFEMQDEGSLCLFRPQNQNAKDWLLATAPEDAQFFGDAIACQHQYVSDMISVIEQEGMSVR